MTATQTAGAAQTDHQQYIEALRTGDRVVALALQLPKQAIEDLSRIDSVRTHLEQIRGHPSVDEAMRQTVAAKAKLAKHQAAMAEAKSTEERLIAEIDAAWSKVGPINSALSSVVHTCLIHREVYEALRGELEEAGIEVSNERYAELSRPLIEPS